MLKLGRAQTTTSRTVSAKSKYSRKISKIRCKRALSGLHYGRESDQCHGRKNGHDTDDHCDLSQGILLLHLLDRRKVFKADGHTGDIRNRRRITVSK